MKTNNLSLMAAIALSAFSSFIYAQAPDKIIISRTDSLLEDAWTKKMFSGMVSIYKDGKEIYFKQKGYADWQSNRPFTKNTLFNIGSLNKQFTEEMIHQLVKEKKLSYEDKLSSHLKIYPAETGDKISIQQLLDMTAGLGDYLMDPAFRKIENTDFTLDALINIIKNEPLLYEPGKSRRYSNSGYVVLGAVIEKVTGNSYEKNLDERIAKPLGIKNFYYTKTEKEAQKDRASGSMIDFEGNKKSMDNYANSTPAGGIYTSIQSLVKFAEAKRKNELLSGKKYDGGSIAGGTPAWNSLISYNQKTGYTYVITANVGRIADELDPKIAAILKNESYRPLVLPFEMRLYKTILEKGYLFVKENAEDLAKQARVPYDGRFFNYFGYQFLNGGKPDIAINLFRINTELFPLVANTYDSLAEAYLKAGDKTKAITFYKKALELDPGNANIKNALTELEK